MLNDLSNKRLRTMPEGLLEKRKQSSKQFTSYVTIFNTDIHHHHPVVCLTTGSKTLPKRSLHILRSRASSFKWQYPLLSLRSSSSFLRLLPCLLVTYISPFIFPSITCFRRQFLRKMWPIHSAFPFLIACRIFLCSLTWSNTSAFLTWSVQLISILLQVFLIYCPKRLIFSYAPNIATNIYKEHKICFVIIHLFILHIFPLKARISMCTFRKEDRSLEIA